MLFYDFEVFKYDWLVVIIDVINKKEYVIINDADKLQELYDENKYNVWVGYNSRHYDQYILKGILCDFEPKKINDYIIIKGNPGWKFSSLFRNIKIINYDVMTGFHSLKQLEGYMGNDIKESSVPFNIDRKLTQEEIDETVKYCRHDVEQTIVVFMQKKEEFESHVSLLKVFKLPLYYISKTKAQLSSIILGATKKDHDDEFEIIFPDTLRIHKYKEVVNWYKNPLNRNYNKTFKIEIAGVPHIFAWGGLHGAISKYHGEGYFLNIDVVSYYPALMIEYDFISRNIKNPVKYREIRDERLRLKTEKNPMEAPYKIILNSTYGAMKDKHNSLFDPRQANNVCVGGQLLLLDLIERLEGYCQLIQSNTDGILIKLFKEDDFELIDDICHEWEQRTRMQLEFDEFRKVFQKDVNSYIIVSPDGKYKSKGAYVKKLNNLDYDLSIVNRALINHMVYNISVEQTINECDKLKEFQLVSKISGKYTHILHDEKIVKEKCIRIFASKDRSDGGVKKVSVRTGIPAKISNSPDKCFIVNGEVNDMKIPKKLDKEWYIKLATKRLDDFGISSQLELFKDYGVNV